MAVAQDRSGKREDYERAEQALTYLQCSQDTDQGWPQVQFIRPRMHDPYGSRTITSMYVLKAAVAWQRWAAANAADRYQKLAVMGGR